MKKSSKNLLLLVAVLLVVLAAYRVLFPPALPDDQQIRNEIAAAVIAAQNKDVPGLTRPLSDQFQDGNGYTVDQLRYMLGRNIRTFESISVTTSSVEVTVHGDTAKTEQYVTVDAIGEGGGNFKYHGPLNLEWEKGAGYPAPSHPNSNLASCQN